MAARLDDGVRPATIQSELAILNRALHLAERAGKARRPPFPILRVSNVRSGFFESDAFRAVLAALPAAIQPLVEFAYHTGWRLGEILPLTWRQIDLKAGIIRLEPGSTKNKEGRVFPARSLPPLAALLERQREVTTATEREKNQIIPWVFHRQGQPIRNFRGAWAKACIAAGFFRVVNPEAPSAQQRRKATKCSMTCDGPPSGTLSEPASPGRWL